MAAAKYNIIIEQGTDFALDIQLKNADGSEINLHTGTTAVTIDGNGDSARLKAFIKRTPETDNINDGAGSPTDISFKFEKLAVIDDDIAETSAAIGSSGRLRLKMTDSLTKLLPPDNLQYDLFRSDGTSWFKDLEGKITIIEQITVPV